MHASESMHGIICLHRREFKPVVMCDSAQRIQFEAAFVPNGLLSKTNFRGKHKAALIYVPNVASSGTLCLSKQALLSDSLRSEWLE